MLYVQMVFHNFFSPQFLFSAFVLRSKDEKGTLDARKRTGNIKKYFKDFPQKFDIGETKGAIRKKTCITNGIDFFRFYILARDVLAKDNV